MWAFLRRLVRLLLGLPARGRDARNQADRRQASEDFLGVFPDGPAAGATTVRLIGGPAEDGLSFRHEQREGIDREGAARQIDVYEARTCSCGHLIDQHNRVASTCQICQAVLCQIEGCGGGTNASCAQCGAACCPRHRHTYEIDEDETVTYCERCSWWHPWRLFWGLYS